MMGLKEMERQVHLTEWIWPLLESEPTMVKRFVLTRLAALWLKQEAAADQERLLRSMIEGIELRIGR